MSKKIFIIACEPSGDSHGASLTAELKKLEPTLELRGLGGPLMAEAGVSLIQDMTKISALGFGDVLRQYFRYRKIFYRALREIESFKPDTIILIDSPAFNLRFSKKINKRFPVIYYISPQLWAWGGQRISVIKKFVSKMLVILPFEKDFYDKAGVACEWVGHPLLDRVNASKNKQELREDLEIKEEEIAIGLLPGSRASEVKRILPAMLETADLIKKDFPQASFFLTESPNVPGEVYDKILSRGSSSPHALRRGSRIPDPRLKPHCALFARALFGKNWTFFSENVCGNDGIRRIRSRMHDVLTAMDFALIASGTATLEATVLGTPFFLLYKASGSTYILGRMLVKVKFLGMTNLLAGKSVVPEFIQKAMHPEKMAGAAKKYLENRSGERTEMLSAFSEVRKKLGEPGASHRAAEAILKSLNQKVSSQ